MLENVKTQIANALGGDFLMFWNTAHEDIKLAEANANKVVGSVFESFGTYKAIENSLAYDGGIVIEFAVPTEDKTLYQKYVGKINEVIQSKNAHFEVISYSDEGAKVGVVNYVLIFDGLKASGNEEVGFGSVMRQTLSLSVKVAYSPDLNFGNKTTVQIKNEIINQWLQLENCLNVDFVGQQQTIQKVVTASFESTSVPQYEVSRVIVTYLYKNESKLHEIIQHKYMSGDDAPYDVRLTMNNDVLEFKAVCASYTHSNPIGGFQTIQTEFVRADVEKDRPRFTLTIGNVQNGTIKVTRDGMSLKNGDAIILGDELKISAIANLGYIVQTLQVNSANFSNGGSYVAIGDTEITAEFVKGSLPNCTIEAIVTVPAGISASEVEIRGYKIRDNDGNEFNELVIDTSTNDKTYMGKYGDVVRLQYIVSDAMKFKSFKFNDSAVANLYEATLTQENNTIECVAESIPLTLTLVANGVNFNIMRGSEQLQNGAKIKYNDVLTVNFTAFGGYSINEVYVDMSHVNAPYTNGQQFTVTSDVKITGKSFSTLTYRYNFSDLTSRTANYGEAFRIIDGSQWSGDGIEFKYWTTSKDGNGTKYYPGDTYTGEDEWLYWYGEKKKKTAYVDMYVFTQSGIQAMNLKINQSPNSSATYNATSKLTLGGTYNGKSGAWNWSGTINVGEFQSGAINLTNSGGIPVTKATLDILSPKSDDTYNYVKGGIYYLS